MPRDLLQKRWPTAALEVAQVRAVTSRCRTVPSPGEAAEVRPADPVLEVEQGDCRSGSGFKIQISIPTVTEPSSTRSA